MMSDLVLAFCSSYSVDQVKPFLLSLRLAEPKATIVMFTAHMGYGFTEFASTLGIDVKDAQPYLNPSYHPQSARYFMYRDYMKSNEGLFSKVLLTDVRDVVFQRPFFALVPDSNVLFFPESIRMCDDSVYNGAWIAEFYGDQVLESISDREVSCSGTTLGGAKLITEYIDLMVSEITTRTRGKWTPHDQGFHNYILRILNHPKFILQSDMALVATVGTMSRLSPNRVKVTKDGIEVDGCVPTIVHQYDRREDMRLYVDTIYQ